MSRLSAFAVLCAVIIATPVAARLSASARQSPTPSPAVASAQSPQGRGTTPPPIPPPAPPPSPVLDRNAPGWSSNVRVELTISETQGGTTTTKNVVLITSNTSRGSIRSDMSSPTEGEVTLNVDARPQIQRDGRIGLDITFVYTPQRSPDAVTAGAHSKDIQEQMSVYLTDGKPLVVSQSADPRGDRRITVEVTATIAK
jgi:hypothetical protein